MHFIFLFFIVTFKCIDIEHSLKAFGLGGSVGEVLSEQAYGPEPFHINS